MARPGATERDEQPAVPILFVDDHLLVVSKPSRCLVVGAPGRAGSTIVDRLRRQIGGEVFAVHRLDEDTTGTLVLARTEQARALLEDLFRSHRVERVYLALLSAMPNPPAGRIESAVDVGDDGIVRSVAAGHGTRAVTEYRAVARRGGCTLVECRLETGRRNQIRVHMAELGCPIAGDRKYGFRGWAGQRWRRPMLHAWRIGLLHPITGDRLELESTPEERELRR